MENFERIFSPNVLKFFTKPYSFVLDNVFGKNTPVYMPGTVLDRDIIRDNPTYADFYGYYTTSLISENEGLESSLIQLPLMKAARNLTPEDLTHRVAGMLDVQSISETSRANAKAVKLMSEKIKKNYAEIRKTMELSAIDALFNYEVVVKGQGVDRKITYSRPAALSVTLGGADLWTNTAADIPAQVRDAVTDCFDNTNGIVPTMAIMNTATSRLFLANAKIQDLFKRNDQSTIGITGFSTQELATRGIIRLGVVHNVEFFAYDCKYFDPTTKTTKNRVPDNKVAFFGVDFADDPLISNTVVYGIPPVLSAQQTSVFRPFVKPIMDDNQIVTNMYYKDGENPSLKFVTEATALPFIAQPFSITYTVA